MRFESSNVVPVVAAMTSKEPASPDVDRRTWTVSLPAGAQVSRAPPARAMTRRSRVGGPRGHVPQKVMVRTCSDVWPWAFVALTRRSYEPASCQVFQTAAQLASGWGPADGPPALQGINGKVDGSLVQLPLPLGA